MTVDENVRVAITEGPASRARSHKLQKGFKAIEPKKKVKDLTSDALPIQPGCRDLVVLAHPATA